jgi:serine/threonine protein kinase
MDPFLGITLNGYKIAKFLNEGAYGRVYLAQKLETGKNFVIKIQKQFGDLL